MSINKFLVVVAIICFVLAAFSISILGITLGWMGLAFLAAAKLVV